MAKGTIFNISVRELAGICMVKKQSGFVFI